MTGFRPLEFPTHQCVEDCEPDAHIASPARLDGEPPASGWSVDYPLDTAAMRRISASMAELWAELQRAAAEIARPLGQLSEPLRRMAEAHHAHGEDGYWPDAQVVTFEEEP